MAQNDLETLVATMKTLAATTITQFQLPEDTGEKTSILEKFYRAACPGDWVSTRYELSTEGKDVVVPLQQEMNSYLPELVSGIESTTLTRRDCENADTENLARQLELLGVEKNVEIRRALWGLAKRTPAGIIDSYVCNRFVKYAMETKEGFNAIAAIPEFRSEIIARMSYGGHSSQLPIVVVDVEKNYAYDCKQLRNNPRGDEYAAYNKRQLAMRVAYSHKVIAAIDAALGGS
jgi:hypothetical protein